jgi:hypothetical protein
MASGRALRTSGRLKEMVAMPWDFWKRMGSDMAIAFLTGFCRKPIGLPYNKQV